MLGRLPDPVRKGGEHEEVGFARESIGIRADRQEDHRSRGLARGDPERDAQAHPRCGPGCRGRSEMEKAVEFDARRPGVVPRRDHLHRRDLREHVKLTFAKGASLGDTGKLFNSSLDGNTRRAIDIHEEEKVDARAFKALVRAAVDLNTALGKEKPKRTK